MKRVLVGVAVILVGGVIALAVSVLRSIEDHHPRSCPGTRFVLSENFVGCLELELFEDGGTVFPKQEGYSIVEVTHPGQKLSGRYEEPQCEGYVEEVWVRTDAGIRLTELDAEDARSLQVGEVNWVMREEICFGGAKHSAAFTDL